MKPLASQAEVFHTGQFLLSEDPNRLDKLRVQSGPCYGRHLC